MRTCFPEITKKKIDMYGSEQAFDRHNKAKL